MNTYKDHESSRTRICRMRRVASMLVALLFVMPTVSAQVDLIVNGNFESGFVADGTCDPLEPDSDQLPVAWGCFETFSTGPEPSLINAFPLNGPSAPGLTALRLFRSDRCHLSGDWTTVEQTLSADVSTCQRLTLSMDVLLLPLEPPASHNLGGSGHVGGPCDASGFEYPATVVIRYADAAGVGSCWQYGWYQFDATKADRTDSECFSGFDGMSANPDPAVSQQIPVGSWVPNVFDLVTTLGPISRIESIRIGGSGWSFEAAIDNVQLICDEEPMPCEQGPFPQCLGECPPASVCSPVAGDLCRCLPTDCEQGPFPECLGECPPGTTCVPDSLTGACRCVGLCEEGPFPECLGDCPPDTACAPDPTTGSCFCSPLCEQSPWPECLGGCPPETICVPDDTGVCRCEPQRCENTPFPECLGACPDGTICVADSNLNTCSCLPVDCEQGAFPECLGQCPPGTVCEPDDSGVCRCVQGRCEDSPFPECLGDCPPGSVCVVEPTTGICGCQPLCEQGPFPECLGDCPPGTGCMAEAGTNACRCEPLPCEQGPFPECLGECPEGTVCVTDPAGAPQCVCEAVPCDQSPFAECAGACPLGTTCVPDPDTGQCRCEAVCEQSEHSECLGDCPPGTMCIPDPSGIPECLCVPAPCEQGPFPECLGGCPPGTICVTDTATGACRCERIFCDQSPFPECFGDCPPETICVADPGGFCRCEPIRCEDGPFPECLGDCPPGTVCVADPAIGCQCTPVLCEQTPFPECLGDCPPGTICVPDTVTGACICEPVPCEQWPFPECFGDCPPGTICVPDTVTGACTCEPVPCEQWPFPECLGDCPPGTNCVPDTVTGACVCEPVPCEQSPFPECLGGCPPGTTCLPDTQTGECSCSLLGQACDQCGPGPHFVDMCGPFPPVGTDLVSDNSAIVGIDLDLDCIGDLSLALRPCPFPNELLRVDKTLGPIDDSVNFPGTSPVDGHPTGPGLDVIDTEIVSMCLTDGAITLVAGTGGPSALPLLPSLGTVAEDLTTPDPTMADSFFDVFFEVSGVPGGPVYNQTPLEVRGRIDCLPPAASYQHPARSCLPLTTQGICNGGPNGGNPCISDSDCPGGGFSCDGEVVVANLVSANHSVNQPICNDSPFPECLGDCPPGTICAPDTVTGACICEPVACEQGPFPECLGDCPPGTTCVADPSGVTACICEPVGCSETFFPECDGGCPPGERCANVPGTDQCECIPEEPPCDTTFPPVCDGSCPPGQRCEFDGDASCGCRPCTIVPPGVVGGVFFPEKTRFRWLALPCANVYNVYRFTGSRLVDADSNGLADDYGSCFLRDLPITEAVDMSIPAPNQLHHYLVTGENATGEGSLGYASNLMMRPNLTPCP